MQENVLRSIGKLKFDFINENHFLMIEMTEFVRPLCKSANMQLSTVRA